MSNAHPVLEAVARAIALVQDGHEDHWEDFLLVARAALNALADQAHPSAYLTGSYLRETAAEPVTVEGVLAAHRVGYVGDLRQCSCGSNLAPTDGSHPAHVADMLRAAGLVKEDA